MKTRNILVSTLVAAAAATFAASAFAATPTTDGNFESITSWDVSSGSVYKYSSGSWLTGSYSDGAFTFTETTGTPARADSKGFILYFDGTNTTVSASASSDKDTSDGGGIVVTGTGNTVTASLGRWAGSIQVDAGNTLNTLWTQKLKDATIVANGTVNITSGNLDLDGAGARSWSVGVDGSINFSTATTLSTGTVTVDGVIDNTAGSASAEGLTNRTVGINVKEKHLVSFAKGLSTGLDSLSVGTIYKKGDTSSSSLTSVSSVTDVDTAGEYYAEKTSSGITIYYAVDGEIVKKALTWAGTDSSSWTEKGTSWTDSASTTTSFVSGDDVTFSDAATSKAVSVGSDLTVGAMAVSDDYTFSSDTSGTARTITADSFSLTAGKSATFTDVSLNSSGSVNIGSGSTLSFGGTADTTAAIVLSNTSSNSSATFKKIGSGTTTLTGALTSYYGKIAVDAGTLNVTGTLNDAYLAGITLAAGTTFTYSGDAVGENQRMFSGSGTFTLTGDATVSAASNFGLISSSYNANTVELGSYTLTKTGSATFYLANTTINGTGTFKISEGTVKQVKASSSAEGTTVHVAGGTFDTNGLVFTANGAFNVDSGATVSGSGSVKVAKDSTFAGTLAAGATLNVTGGTTTISSAAQKLSGNLTIASGATVYGTVGDQINYGATSTQTVTVSGNLKLGTSANSYSSGVRWSFGANNKLVLAGGTVSGTGDSKGYALDFFATNTISVTADSTLAANLTTRIISGSTNTGLTVNVDADKTLAITGKICDPGSNNGTAASLIKAGDGKIVLSGDNSGFAGGFTVSAGTLEVSNASALGTGAVSVASGATLKASADVTLSSGTVTLFANGSDALVTNSDSHKITIGSGATLRIDILQFANATAETTDATTKTLTIATANALEINNIAASLKIGTLSDDTWTDLTSEWNLSISTFDVSTGTLTLVAIPEPSAFGLLAGLGALALAISRRRRNHKKF